MGSTVGARVKTGQVIGTGAEINVALDFTPTKVELYNVTGLASLMWSSSMAPASGVKTITAGTMSFVTTGGVTPVEKRVLSDSGDDRGFKIGADTDINVASEIIHYVAIE